MSSSDKHSERRKEDRATDERKSSRDDRSSRSTRDRSRERERRSGREGREDRDKSPRRSDRGDSRRGGESAKRPDRPRVQAVRRVPPVAMVSAEPKVDRETTCPFLLRVFTKVGVNHRCCTSLFSLWDVLTPLETSMVSGRVCHSLCESVRIRCWGCLACF